MVATTLVEGGNSNFAKRYLNFNDPSNAFKINNGDKHMVPLVTKLMTMQMQEFFLQLRHQSQA